jgi:hypothetical protein
VVVLLLMVVVEAPEPELCWEGVRASSDDDDGGGGRCGMDEGMGAKSHSFSCWAFVYTSRGCSWRLTSGATNGGGAIIIELRVRRRG